MIRKESLLMAEGFGSSRERGERGVGGLQDDLEVLQAFNICIEVS